MLSLLSALKYSWRHLLFCFIFSYFPKVRNSPILTVLLWFIPKLLFLGWSGRQGSWIWEGSSFLRSAEHAEDTQQLLPNFIPVVRTVPDRTCYLEPKPQECTALWCGTCPQWTCDFGWLCGNHQQGGFHLLDTLRALYRTKWINGRYLLRWMWKPYLKTSYMKYGKREII